MKSNTLPTEVQQARQDQLVYIGQLQPHAYFHLLKMDQDTFLTYQDLLAQYERLVPTYIFQVG